MITRLLFGLPLSVLFMTMSDQWNLAGFIVGYLVGVLAMMLSGEVPGRVNWLTLPGQLFWLVIYILRLAWDILLSGFDVAWRVLSPRLLVSPGHITVPIQNDDDEFAIAALSAHSITVTPGEMVEGFAEIDGEPHMLVHSLYEETSKEKASREQLQRLNLLRRIMGGSKS